MHVRMMVDMAQPLNRPTYQERRNDVRTALEIARGAVTDPDLSPFEIVREAAHAVTGVLSLYGFRTSRYEGEGAWYQVEPTGRRRDQAPLVWLTVWPVDQHGNFLEEPRGWNFTGPQAIALCDQLLAIDERPEWDAFAATCDAAELGVTVSP